MDILQKDDSENGELYIQIESKVMTKMTYNWAGTDRIIIDHTEVNDFLRCKNVGKQLVAKAVECARNNTIKIIPLCSFAKSVFQKTPEYSCVL